MTEIKEPLTIDENLQSKVKIVNTGDPYTWTPGIIATLENRAMRCSELKTGCGLAQIYYITGFLEDEFEKFKAILDKIIESFKKESGTFICTLGSHFYEKYYKHIHDFLLKYGFTVVSEYRNLKHSNSQDYQRLYIYTV